MPTEPTYLDKPTYLGDGLYASFDGYQIILSTDRDGVTHYVALEPEVAQAFARYAVRVFPWIAKPTGKDATCE